MLGQSSAAGRMATSESGEGHSVSYGDSSGDAMQIGSVASIVNMFRSNFVA